MTNIQEADIKNALTRLLQKQFANKLDKNPSYSLRALARDMGVSVAYLSQCFRGEKKLSFDRAIQIAKILKIPTTEKDTFFDLMTLQLIKNQKQRESYIQRHKDTDWRILLEKTHHFFLLKKWYYLPILDLTTCKNFKSDLQWIANKLDLPASEVKTAVEQLIETGFLEVRGNCWIKTNRKMQIPTNKSHSGVRGFHAQMINKAYDLASKPTVPGDFEIQDFSGTTFAVDPKKIVEAKKMITEFRQKLGDFLMEGDSTEVYQLNIQLFPLTHHIQGENQ